MAQARILNASWHRFMRRKLETLAMQEARQKSCQKKLDETNLDFDISMCGYSLQDTVCIQVVPGRAGGGSFKRKKNYIAKKEFAYRMCAR